MIVPVDPEVGKRAARNLHDLMVKMLTDAGVPVIEDDVDGFVTAFHAEVDKQFGPAVEKGLVLAYNTAVDTALKIVRESPNTAVAELKIGRLRMDDLQ